MVPPEELEKAQPTTLPADFGEWDSGDGSATHPANFNGFESFPASAAAPKPPVNSSTARVAVLPVAGRSPSAASRPPAAAYADVEQAYQPPKSKAVKTAAPVQRAESESEGKKGQTGMFIGVGAAALLLIGGTVGYFTMHSKTAAPSTTAMTQTQVQTPAANSLTPTPATQTVANTPAQANTPAAADTAAAAEADSALRAQADKMNKQLNAPSLIQEDLKTLAGGAAPPPTSGFSPAGMEGVGTTSGVFNGQGGPKVKVAAPQKVSISGAMAVGMLVQRTQPVYPPLAKQAHISGTVTLQATVSKTGSVVNPHVISGPPLLRQAALDAVKTWRFRPYMLDGEPTEVETTVDVNFALAY
ncbi:MAG: TonB family protein [Terracidiphilus sp.]